MVIFKPKFLIGIEGAAVLLTACFYYQQVHGNWWWFALLFLAPDVSILGYLVNKRIGAACYNFAHTYTLPLALLGVLSITGHSSFFWLGIIWLAHIGFDRLLGFGLKYESDFKDTHLQRI